jgi:hypothetical protein
VLVIVSCQANLALPSDLVTGQLRNGGEHDNRADDDRFGDDAEDQVLRGIGEVCIAASRLEGAMAFLAMTVQNWSDEKYRRVQSRSGKAMRAFEALVPELEECGLGSDARSILADAAALRDLRNRAVHSVMMFELREANQRLYQAWHARSDELWDIDPAELHELALKLAAAASKTDDLGYDWEVRTGRSKPLETLADEFLPDLQDEL